MMVEMRLAIFQIRRAVKHPLFPNANMKGRKTKINDTQLTTKWQNELRTKIQLPVQSAC